MNDYPTNFQLDTRIDKLVVQLAALNEKTKNEIGELSSNMSYLRVRQDAIYRWVHNAQLIGIGVTLGVVARFLMSK
jgi:hypothetical protein